MDESKTAPQPQLAGPDHTLDMPAHGIAPQSTAPPPSHRATLQHDTGAPTFVNRPSAETVPGYEILGELGRGGMGVVYKARQTKANRLVALKMILGSQHAEVGDKIRFQIEVEAIARLQHSNIVQLHEAGEHGGMPYFSLEFCDGGSLDRQLKGQPMSAADAATLVETLARAMHYAHSRGVIHRDLKPANVLLQISDCRLQTDRNAAQPSAIGHRQSAIPKITDFGLAKRTDGGSDLSQSGAIMGTPSYMAPEQAAGKVRDIGPAADVYALGAILYECLTGRPPFRGETAFETVRQVLQDDPVPPSSLNPKMPRDVETICLKCLAKEPARRYATAEALADDLRRWRQHEPITARPVGGIERAVKWTRRRPAVAALLLVTVLGIGGIVWKYLDAEQQRKNAEEQRRIANDRTDDYRKQKEIADAKTADESKARTKAQDEEKKAITEADRARRAEVKAKTELRRAEGLVYAGHLREAQQLWEAGHIAAARERLEACRWDLRGWEHSFLRRQFNESSGVIRGHQTVIRGIAFSPDGSRLASASYDGTVRVWDAASGREILVFKGHTAPSHCVCFSPDGKWIASGGFDSMVRIWNSATGKELRAIKGHTESVLSVCFSSDGKRLASSGREKTVKIWDVEKGTPIHTLKGHTDIVTSVAFSPNGKRLASASGDKTIRIWDTITGKVGPICRGHTASVASVAYSPDGTRVVSGSADRSIRVWREASGSEETMINGHEVEVRCVAWSPDGRHFASCCGNDFAGKSQPEGVKVWRMDDGGGQPIAEFRGHTEHVGCICFSPDGSRVASGGDDSTVRIWGLAGGGGPRTLVGHTGAVMGLCVSPDGKWVASASDDSTVKIWNAATGQERITFSDHNAFVYGVSFDPDSKRVASGGFDRTAKVWDMATGKVETTCRLHMGFVLCVAFSPDGTRVASGSDDRTVRVWDPKTGMEILTLGGHTTGVHSVCWSRDGKFIAGSGGMMGDISPAAIRIWDATSGKEVHTLRAGPGEVRSVCFSPDGTRLASAGFDRTVRIWDVASGKEVLTLTGHPTPVWSVCYSADGQRLVSGSGGPIDQPGEVKVWDAATGQDLLTVKQPTALVTRVSLSPDDRFLTIGTRVTTGKHPGQVILLDTAAGRAVFTCKGNTSPIGALGFSADGERLVAQGKAGELRAWDVESGQPVVPCTDMPPARNLSADSGDGKLSATADGKVVRVVRKADQRPPANETVLRALSDPGRLLGWHRTEAATAEEKKAWYTAAFHLRRLIAAQAPDLAELKMRLKRCEDMLPKP